jgi:hypothetical protein
LHNRALLVSAFVTVLLHAAVATAHHLFATNPNVLSASLVYYVAVTLLLVPYSAVIRSVGSNPSRSNWVVLLAVPALVQIGWVLRFRSCRTTHTATWSTRPTRMLA